MAKRITNVTGIFGETRHYDEHGKYLGYSQPGILGETNHYDASGHRVGYSTPGIFGEDNLYNNEAQQVGYTAQSPLAGQVLHTRDGRTVPVVQSVFDTDRQNTVQAEMQHTYRRKPEAEAFEGEDDAQEYTDESLGTRFWRWLKKGLFE